MDTKRAKLVVYVPKSHADQVRAAMGDAGGGQIGKYTHCSFSVTGVGRYIPGHDANPHLGQRGKLEQVVEERIETVCPIERLETVIEAVKKVHPYEEVALEVYPLLF